MLGLLGQKIDWPWLEAPAIDIVSAQLRSAPVGLLAPAPLRSLVHSATNLSSQHFSKNGVAK
jgi:hypothetical protein